MAAFAFFGAFVCSCGSSESAGDDGNSDMVGIVAHRGYWNCEEAGYAENSIAALRCAQEYGFWASEFDLQMTSDEVVVITHDSKIDGRPIGEIPYSEIADITLPNGEKLPTIDAFFAQAAKNPKTMLICEFKKQATPEREDRLLEIAFAKMREYGIYNPAQVILVAFSKHICEVVTSTLPEFTILYPDKDCDPNQLAESGINGVYYKYTVYGKHPDWYEQARANGMFVDCWTVDDEENMMNMLNLGVDLITTNEPVFLRGLLKELGKGEL